MDWYSQDKEAEWTGYTGTVNTEIINIPTNMISNIYSDYSLTDILIKLVGFIPCFGVILV